MPVCIVIDNFQAHLSINIRHKSGEMNLTRPFDEGILQQIWRGFSLKPKAQYQG